MKTPDWNDLKLGTVVVLDSQSKPIDLGSNGQESGTGSLACVFWDCSQTHDNEEPGP